MKSILGTCLLLLLIIGLTSCEVCTTCHIIEYGYSTADSTERDQEFCGTSGQVRQYKEDLSADLFHHKKVAGTAGFKLNCVDQ